MPTTRRSSSAIGMSKSPMKERNVTPKKSGKKAKKRTVTDRSPAIEPRKKSASCSDAGDKENRTPIRSPEGGVVQKPTPYWKVAEERGTSPRITRSSSKRPCNIPRVDDSDKAEVSKGLFQLEFSPPNPAENRKRELRKEKERDKRLKQQRRQEGDVSFLSPTGRNESMASENGICLELTDDEAKFNAGDGTAVRTSSVSSPITYTSSHFDELKTRFHEVEKENVSLRTENIMLNKSLAKVEQNLEKTRSAKERLIIEKTKLEGQVGAFLNPEWKKGNQDILCRAEELQLNVGKFNSSRTESEIRARMEELERENQRLCRTVGDKDREMKNQLLANEAALIAATKDSETLKSLEAQLDAKNADLEAMTARNQELELVLQREKQQREEENKSMVAIDKLSEQEAEIEELCEQHEIDEQTIASLRSELSSMKEKLSIYEEEIKFAKEELDGFSGRNEKLRASVDRLTDENQLYVGEIEKLKGELEKSTQECNDLKILLKQSYQEAKAVQSEHDSVKMALVTANSENEEKENRITNMMKQMTSFNGRESELLQKIILQEELRRSLHNRVIQLSGNIRVFIRVRPCIPCELAASEDSESPFSFPSLSASVSVGDDLTKRFIVATEPEKDRGGLSQRRKRMKFGFDNVFNPNSNQEDIWGATEPLVQSAVDGYNVCVFAYGQTGSGKTYTMLGGNESSLGLVSKSVQKLFDAKKLLEDTSHGKTTADVSIELLEIYNEQVRDLMSTQKNGEYKSLNISVHSNEAIGNVVFPASNENEVFSVLAKAQKRRCVKATDSNEESSRSHLLITMNFIVKNSSGIVRKSKLHICDLAGSERLNKSHATGSTLNETKHINKSLSILSNVIEKLQQKSKHVPFRESKLTYLLRNSLGGDSKTLAIVCCNPLAEHFQETCCSLRFAHKLSNVELKSLGNISC